MRKSTKVSKALDQDAAKSSEEVAADPVAVVQNPSRFRLDGIEYDASEFNEQSKAILSSLRFAETRLLELRNELAVCQTAQIAYLNALKLELPASVDK